jgi:hypothetical protein
MSGQPDSFLFTVPTAGGPLNYTKGAPPDGITDTWKWIDDRSEDIFSTQNGKQVLQTHVVISANQKLMTITTSGVDEKGKAFRTVSIYDHQ